MKSQLINGEAIAVKATALTGYLLSLRFEKCDRRGKEVHKLLTTIEADRLYILESGHDTHFSKGRMALRKGKIVEAAGVQRSRGAEEQGRNKKF
ncbi:MAG: hypothetical protein V7K48_11375 [Nostoc sp.]|uniref:hypothetical protein n=1 Tax=Nostoc sp. TaxID=1180 RepID=UPI002FF5E621